MTVKLSQILKKGEKFEPEKIDLSTPEVKEYLERSNERQESLRQLKEKPFENLYIII
jgi:hypothetical protein